MDNFDPFNNYLGLSEALFEADIKHDESDSLSYRFSTSSSMDSISSDNSSNFDTANASSTLYQWNRLLEPLPETSTTSPLATMSPLAKTPFDIHNDLSLYADDIFSQSAENAFFSSMDITRNASPAPASRAITGRNMTPTQEISNQRQDATELEVNGCNFYAPFQQNSYSSSCDLSQMVHGMVRNACKFEVRAAADKLSLAKACVFCQRNGETKEFCSTHILKDSKGRVICPVLRNYVCPSCNATGDKADTLRHCPLSKNASNMADTFKTRRTSCGFRKFTT